MFFIIAFPETSASQASLVPLTHPVYDWLHYQRVEGRISGYHVELAPYSRADITSFLKEIERSDRPLNRRDARTLQSWLKEFDRERLREASVRRSWNKREGLVNKLTGLWHDQPEPYLLRYENREHSMESYLYVSGGRARVNAWDDEEWGWARYYVKGVNGFLNVGNHLGLQAWIDNVSAEGESGRPLLQLDPEWGSSYSMVHSQRDQSSYSYEVFANFQYGLINIDLGRGSLEFGPSVSEPLVFRREAPNINWLRFSVGNGRVNYMHLHGSLKSYPETSQIIVNGKPATTRTAPQRWVAVHRLTLEPISQLTIGFYEMVLYSNRPMDIMYLNPVMPFIFAELDAGDMDKNLIGADIRIRPFKGNELFGSLFIDDLINLSDIKRFENTKVGLNIGFHQSLPFSSRIGAAYTRIDPHMYSHRHTLNTFEQAGKPLAHSLGPNSEEWAAKWTTWLPYRSRITAEVQLAKKGMNPVDDQGNVTANVGGDLLVDGLSTFGKLYEGADVHKMIYYKLEVQTEPIRGLNLSVRAWDRRMMRGSQITPLRYVDLRVGVGF